MACLCEAFFASLISIFAKNGKNELKIQKNANLAFSRRKCKKMQKYARKSKKHIIFDLELTGFVKKLGIADSKQLFPKKNLDAWYDIFMINQVDPRSTLCR